MKNYQLFFLLSVIILSQFSSCKNSDGVAPSSGYSALKINPLAIIAPKSTTLKITVLGVSNTGVATDDLTKTAKCTTSNPIATIDSNGNLGNSYTGTAIQKLVLTCTYDNLTKSADVTIVPAVLTSLVFTKNSLLMGPNQSQNIQVYGNFIDSNNYVFALEMTNYITWSSNNSTVSQALVDVVSSGSAGTANITASFGAISNFTTVTVNPATVTPTANPKGVGLLGSYYDFGIANPSAVPWTSSTIGDPFEKLFGQRIDSQVYFNWSTGTNNLGQVAYFGIRWTGRIYIPTTGTYNFFTNTDDGVRLWIDDVGGTPAIDNWTLHAITENTTANLNLTGGQFYNIKMDYFENAGYSAAELRWQGPGISKQLIPQIYLFPN